MSATQAGIRPASGRPMRADARRNYERLLAQAGAAFAERGTDEVSLEEIARRAGVGIGTLYRHFPTRQDLIAAVYQDQVEGLARQARTLLESNEPGPALAQWLAALTDFAATKKTLSRALVEGGGAGSELFATCGAMLRESAIALVDRARAAGAVRPDVRGTDVLRLVHGMMLACDAMPGDPGQTDRMLNLVVAGILTS